MFFKVHHQAQFQGLTLNVMSFPLQKLVWSSTNDTELKSTKVGFVSSSMVYVTNVIKVCLLV